MTLSFNPSYPHIFAAWRCLFVAAGIGDQNPYMEERFPGLVKKMAKEFTRAPAKKQLIGSRLEKFFQQEVEVERIPLKTLEEELAAAIMLASAARLSDVTLIPRDEAHWMEQEGSLSVTVLGSKGDRDMVGEPLQLGKSALTRPVFRGRPWIKELYQKALLPVCSNHLVPGNQRDVGWSRRAAGALTQMLGKAGMLSFGFPHKLRAKCDQIDNNNKTPRCKSPRRSGSSPTAMGEHTNWDINR